MERKNELILRGGNNTAQELLGHDFTIKVDFSEGGNRVGLGRGESDVYHDKKYTKIGKIYNGSVGLYSDQEKQIIDYPYPKILESYHAFHTIQSKEDILIRVEKYKHGQRFIQKHSNSLITKGNLLFTNVNGEQKEIKEIKVSTLDLSNTTITTSDDQQRCIVKNIEYIPGDSLQHSEHIKNLVDNGDHRSVKVGAEEIYYLGYTISHILNKHIKHKYNLKNMDKVRIGFNKYGYIGSVPKNIKVIGVQGDCLYLTVTDWCASIAYRYHINNKQGRIDSILGNPNGFKNNSGIINSLKNILSG